MYSITIEAVICVFHLNTHTLRRTHYHNKKKKRKKKRFNLETCQNFTTVTHTHAHAYMCV